MTAFGPGVGIRSEVLGADFGGAGSLDLFLTANGPPPASKVAAAGPPSMRRNQSERDREPRRRIAPQSAALRKAIATLDIGYVIRDSPQGANLFPMPRQRKRRPQALPLGKNAQECYCPSDRQQSLCAEPADGMKSH